MDLELLRNPETRASALEALVLEHLGRNVPASQILAISENPVGDNPAVWETFPHPHEDLTEKHPLVFTKNQVAQGPAAPEPGGDLGVRGQIWCLYRKTNHLLVFLRDNKIVSYAQGKKVLLENFPKENQNPPMTS